MSYEELLYYIPFASLMACWLGFGAAFVFRKIPKTSGETKRDNKATTGIIFESVGYTTIWIFRRNHVLLIEEGGLVLGTFFSLLVIILALSSVIMVVNAIKTLGKQWAVAARVVEDHQLITEGPYRIVRNPIYAGMFGMLIATGLAISQWWAILPGCAIFWYGTDIRVKVEEKLLRETFGGKFDEYMSSVPSLIPKLF